MVLSTVKEVRAPGGSRSHFVPRSRVVLLKGYGPEGFDFFTNGMSDKGRELAATPCAALVFWWEALQRQVRVEGCVSPLPQAAAQAYFASRPRDSQLGAHASAQSSELRGGRRELEESFQAARRTFEGQAHVPKPEHWGGYRVTPKRVEFWQGREGRLHDRLVYERSGLEGGEWSLKRLAP
ncbi:hypothetical protein H632_c1514p0 [Helicosporidium sp. ATCC 50920]|nr:hypothetical protein H632_c1514p0 [Helicosporidium sp. ATCC 50920]|eukprot:KDD74168.1 hypothetical protein H632_c1514p0 [Helicosporidium sp. ATCC 50920]